MRDGDNELKGPDQSSDSEHRHDCHIESVPKALGENDEEVDIEADKFGKAIQKGKTITTKVWRTLDITNRGLLTTVGTWGTGCAENCKSKFQGVG